MNHRLPVTLVGGFLGAGKTSLLHHIISEHQGGHLAVLVESPGALNPDAKALHGLCGAMRRLHDTVLEIPMDGDIAWMAARLREFAEAGRYEQVFSEVAGTSSAARLGRYFGLLPGQDKAFAPWAELRQIICVVDALDLHRMMIVRKDAPDLLIPFQREQIANATLLVLNKCDLVGEAERQACTRHLRALNPDAPIVETDYGEVPTEIWSRAATTTELGLALERQPPLQYQVEVVDAPLGSAIYRAHRPFHPQRFWDWFNADHAGLLRVKGLVWLATRNLLVGGISRTRWENSCGAAGIWWAALPREEWPEEPEALARMQQTWQEPYGDRRQEMLLIGNATHLAAMKRQLDACLLSKEEYARPVAEWAAFPDPFPEWDMGE